MIRITIKGQAAFSPDNSLAVIFLSLVQWPVWRSSKADGPALSLKERHVQHEGFPISIHQTFEAVPFINCRVSIIDAGETTEPLSSHRATPWPWTPRTNDVNPHRSLAISTPMVMWYCKNANGFYVGRSPAIAAHGLIMTTASTPAFNPVQRRQLGFQCAAPNRANHQLRQIQNDGWRSGIFDCERHLKTTARFPHRRKNWFVCGGKVLVSMSPMAWLSAQVTLPEGSVDNQGNLIADAAALPPRPGL